MKLLIAIALVIPLCAGLVALVRRPAAPRVEPVLVSSAPKTEVDPPPPEKEAMPLDLELEEMNRRGIEREKTIERLEADYEGRVERLIESIDWTRAESRARFPVEHALLREEFNRAVESWR